jgi:hypothetical protein
MGLVGLLLAGCGQVPGARVSPTVDAAAFIARGGWVEAEMASGRFTVRGELLAVTRDSLYVLPANTPDAGGRARAIGFRQVRSGSVTKYRPDLGLVDAWGVGGTLSTISHGYYLVFTAPMWMLTGGISHANTASEAKIEFAAGDRRHRELAAWARFPQGLPPELRTHIFPPTPWGAVPGFDQDRASQKGPIRLRRHSHRPGTS